MAKYKEKMSALKMRRKGYSIKYIADKLGVSKSSVSLWCRDIKLTKAQRDLLIKNQIKSGHKGRMIGAEMNRKKKLDNIKEQTKIAKDLIDGLSKRDRFMLGIALYWGEGSKKGQLSFTNADSEMILFMVNWFKEFFDLSNDDLFLRVAINEIHKNRIEQVTKYWKDLLEVPESCFRKPTFIKSNLRKVYENNDEYYGMLVIRLKNSSMIKYRTLAFVERVKMSG